MDDGRWTVCDDTGEAELMVARVWTARVRPSDVAAYADHFERAVRPHLESIDGFLDAVVMVREPAAIGDREVVVESRWRSMDAISAFAGNDPNVAVIDPAAAPLFVDYDRTVRHYLVLGTAER